MQKTLVLVCVDSLCPRKQPDVSGPGLGEAGRYTRGLVTQGLRDAAGPHGEAVGLRREGLGRGGKRAVGRRGKRKLGQAGWVAGLPGLVLG